METLEKIFVIFQFIVFFGASTILLHGKLAVIAHRVKAENNESPDLNEGDIQGDSGSPRLVLKSVEDSILRQFNANRWRLVLMLALASLFLSVMAIVLGRGIEGAIAGSGFFTTALAQFGDLFPLHSTYKTEVSFSANMLMDGITFYATYRCFRQIVDNPGLASVIKWVTLDLFIGMVLGGCPRIGKITC